ncbi:RNAseP RNAse MRP subunit Pop6 [Schizosaccharomyces octosporus yFS286]|uniref:RNAseP RNAse MRP subunit Pop6 n=1 Tax=Schizosaccharomyces octosporus (strain yFS286) TaxID=483514 RepID=S9QXS2_SCHOY|nr:RNAseP RNAse MRP subunit Pop6 [Schizosaccharomyces octosporus yFS286]EPX71075.1 RNAseP RNAse MRP subunit Pop6 [Schizosaccharomyces octosporus yFS286]
MGAERIKRAPVVRKGFIVRRKTHLIAMMKRVKHQLERSGCVQYQSTGMAIPQLVTLADKYQHQGYRIALSTETIEFTDEIMTEDDFKKEKRLGNLLVLKVFSR